MEMWQVPTMWWVTVVGGGEPHIAVWLKEVLLSHASLDVWVRLPRYPRDPVKESLNWSSLEHGGVFVASSCLDLVGGICLVNDVHDRIGQGFLGVAHGGDHIASLQCEEIFKRSSRKEHREHAL